MVDRLLMASDPATDAHARERDSRRPSSAQAGASSPASADSNRESSQPLFRPIKKAYEQAADQLRLLIVGGKLPPGSRLPTENELAKRLGVSRTTVREALRSLAAHGLIHTLKGPRGGSFVTLPTLERMTEHVSASVGLLTEAKTLSLEEFLEVRELVEVRAARMAAMRRTPDDIERLRSLLADEPLRAGDERRFIANTDFHSAVVAVCRNGLLYLAAQPIFSVLQPTLFRSSLGLDFYERINADHRKIADAIERADADAAEELMRDHLGFLGPIYERAWREAFGSETEVEVPAPDDWEEDR